MEKDANIYLHLNERLPVARKGNLKTPCFFCWEMYNVFMNPAKKIRNRAIVRMHKKDAKRWTFRALAAYFCIDFTTVYGIWRRDKDVY